MAWNIAPRVERLRKDKGWTKRELARRARVNETHVYKICAGLRPRIEAETVRRLAHALGTTTDYLLGMDVYEEPKSEQEPAEGVLVDA
jgi:transcriptional regulator with XRE-family HTH domain